MRNKSRAIPVVLAALVCLCLLASCGSAPSSETASSSASESAASASSSSAEPQATGTTYQSAWQKRDGYTLKQVVAVSRHNLRAPLEKDQEVLDASTPNEWIEWSSNGSELTVKGGAAETIMGEFFRKWLENEELIPQNYIPEEGAVRFYANPRQRTLATAQFFSSGMLPVANVDIEYHGEYDSRDPVFKPRFGYVSDGYVEAATEEMAKNGGDDGIAGIGSDLQENYDLMCDVLDYKDSKAYKDGEAKDLVTGDSEFGVELDEEPKLSGSINTANKLSDALVLQYYEAEDVKDASFGKDVSYEEWQKIADIRNEYGDVRYDSSLVGVDCAHLLVQEVSNELGKEGRRFAFLCGHDSNMSSLLHAIGAKDYELPDTLETKTPIGSKILFEVWENADGAQFCNIRFAYATTEQIRNLDLLSLEEAPASYDLEFEGIARNEDGLYALADVQKLLADTVAAYDQLAVDYPQEQELDLAA